MEIGILVEELCSTIRVFVCFRCGVVSMGNKGGGFEICRQLAINGVLVILTTRNEQTGAEAVNNLKAAGLFDVVFHQLEVTDPASIASLEKFIETHFGKLDILVSNKFDSRITMFPSFQEWRIMSRIIRISNSTCM